MHYVIIIIAVVVLAYYYLFVYRKRKLARRMIAGVDVVKMTIYKTMKTSLLVRYPDNGGKLAAAATNDIYGCHNQDTLKTYQENQEIIDMELTNLAMTNPDLKQPITDSLRVFVQANQMLGSASMHDMENVLSIFKSVKDRGLFVDGGDAPHTESFLQMTIELAHKYELK